LDGGDGNDTLHKTGGKSGARLAGGPGDDSLESDDGWADELQCGDGRDVITSADDSDHAFQCRWLHALGSPAWRKDCEMRLPPCERWRPRISTGLRLGVETTR
jgi:hypothetical protein